MKWIHRYRRKKVLLRALRHSDSHYDELSSQRDELNALCERSGWSVTDANVVSCYARLDVLDALIELEYGRIDQELTDLEHRSLRCRLYLTAVDRLVSIIVSIATVIERSDRLLHRKAPKKERRSETPAQSGDEESKDIHSRECGLLYI